MPKFTPKTALVTGGGSGIGAGMAAELVSRGAHVVVADVSLANAQRTAANLGALCEAVYLDVTDRRQVEAVIQDIKSRHGMLDCLVNCAGTTAYGEALTTSLDDWERVLSVNLSGTVITTLAAYKIMVEQRTGTIVNMGSLAVFLVDPLFGPYLTSKFGVYGFSRSLAVEAAAYGVNVSVVCPGNIRTPLIGDAYKPSPITPVMNLEQAIPYILRGIERKQRIIAFPILTRIYWWLDRLSPNLLEPLRAEIFRRAKKRI